MNLKRFGGGGVSIWDKWPEYRILPSGLLHSIAHLGVRSRQESWGKEGLG